MRIAITGSTGFLGRHIVSSLNAEHSLVCISRSGDAPSGCVGKKIDVVKGRGLKAAFAKVDVVVHAAGLVSHAQERAQETLDVHLKGTQNVLDAALAAKVRRVVLVSTSGTIAVSQHPDAMATENDDVPESIISAWPYYRSKLYAEQFAMAFQGLDVICLNPSLLLGPGDDVGGMSTHAVRTFLDHGVPIAPSGGISFVDVRDVATVVDSALTKGEAGQRYLIASANMRFVDFYARLARITGRDAPIVAMPKFSRRALGWFPAWGKKEGIGMGIGPVISRADLELSSHYWYADAAKATATLGFSPRDPLATLEDTVADLLEKQGKAFARFS